jgi:hypothetical protein
MPSGTYLDWAGVLVNFAPEFPQRPFYLCNVGERGGDESWLHESLRPWTLKPLA